MIWTHQALAAGGSLTINSAFTGKLYLRAVMSWVGEVPVRGKLSLSVEGALQSLEAALREDAAKEMQEGGAA